MQPDLAQKWDFKVLNGTPVTGQYMKPVFIEFNTAKSEVHGSAACNSFFGSYTMAGRSLTFGPLASTKMYCDDASNKLESEILQSLAKVNNYKFDGDTLVLMSHAEVIARLEVHHAAPDELAGKWDLFYITGRRITFEGLYPRNKPFITFHQGQSAFSANTSCNSMNGTYNGKKGEKLLKLGATTLMACEGEGEPAFVDQLKQVETYEVHGDTLVFYYDNIPTMKFLKENQ